MADPHIEAPLDGFDRLTVRLYRTGVVLAGLAVGATGLAIGWAPAAEPPSRWTLLFAVGLIVANLHLYDRTIRWFIGVNGWTAALLSALGGLVTNALGPWLVDAGLGFAFVVLSAVALKERYCFRLPIVVAVPPLLAGSLVPLRAGFPAPAAALMLAGAAVLGLLAAAKIAMPLHFDIGDKRRYQV